MTEYNVTIPITGYVCVTVEAENEEEAKEKALVTEVTTDDIEQWETLSQIVKGNVFYGIQNRIEVEEA